jgi:hypothetical protein
MAMNSSALARGTDPVAQVAISSEQTAMFLLRWRIPFLQTGVVGIAVVDVSTLTWTVSTPDSTNPVGQVTATDRTWSQITALQELRPQPMVW